MLSCFEIEHISMKVLLSLLPRDLFYFTISEKCMISICLLCFNVSKTQSLHH